MAELHLKAGLAERFVNSYLAKWYAFGSLREDLRQEAGRGILRAAEVFDPQRGASFPAFAWNWMRVFVRAYAKSNVGATTGGPGFAPIPFDVAQDNRPTDRSDPSDLIDAPRVWAVIAAELQSALIRKGRRMSREIERCRQEVEDFLRHEFGGITLQTIAIERGVSRQRIHKKMQRLRADFRVRYPEAWNLEPGTTFGA